MTTPTPAPAPMAAERYSIERIRRAQILEPVGAQQFAQHTYASDIRALLEQYDAITASVAELERERDELQQVFDARWDADQRAIKRWRSAAPGREAMWPDHADLCVWLLEQKDGRDLEMLRMFQEAANSEAELREQNRACLDLLRASETTLAAALSAATARVAELERERDDLRADAKRLVDEKMPFVERALAAEAQLKEAREKTLEEAADLVETLPVVCTAGQAVYITRRDSEIAAAIRSLKDTTP